ncbi:MAG: RpiB/LacA/LacB family sugar-phosphate isomerase [Flavobacteriales bacterium]|nr:RpiB/LacA/LacB family sugar-phosphate isomerase [Flavobacteriales bacterium]
MPDKLSRRIAIANDHAGTELKTALMSRFPAIDWVNFGADTSESVDYPDFAHPLAESVANGQTSLGILICGSGNGVCMSANKHQNIRAALCWNEEISALARQHNNANVCCLPARFISEEEAVAIVQRFLETEFEGGRHGRRVEKIPC